MPGRYPVVKIVVIKVLGGENSAINCETDVKADHGQVRVIHTSGSLGSAYCCRVKTESISLLELFLPAIILLLSFLNNIPAINYPS